MSLSLKRHRRRKLKSEINVVPYIDVMLVLLIIFMITAPLLNLGVDVDLPKSNAKSLQQKTDPVVVQVDAQGHYFLTVKAGTKEAVSAPELTARLSAIVSQNREAQVLIGADGSSSYQTVTDAIDLLKKAGVEKVSLISAPKGSAK